MTGYYKHFRKALVEKTFEKYETISLSPFFSKFRIKRLLNWLSIQSFKLGQESVTEKRQYPRVVLTDPDEIDTDPYLELD